MSHFGIVSIMSCVFYDNNSKRTHICAIFSLGGKVDLIIFCGTFFSFLKKKEKGLGVGMGNCSNKYSDAC